MDLTLSRANRRHVLRAAAVAGGALGLAATVGTPAQARRATDPVNISWTGLRSPESVVHDRVTDTYLVSNIDGPVAAKDNNGFVARLNPAGGAAVPWLVGGKGSVTLHAPKGLALTRTTLWVADIDTVRGFHRWTGQPVTTIPVPGASFLNDIAIGPEGGLYVTDSGVAPDATGAIVPTGTDAIYHIGRHRIRAVARGTHLNQPNGIYVREDHSMLVGTRNADQLLTMDDTGRLIERRTVPGRVVDGVQVLPDGRTAVSTWQQPGLWRVDSDGSTAELIPGLAVAGAADFAVDHRRARLLLPALLINQLQVVPLEPIQSTYQTQRA